MKHFRALVFLVVAVLLVPSGIVRAEDEPQRRADVAAASQTVFYAVLEGCFADGLTDADVDQILRREAPDQGPVHFVYACPVCTAAEEALTTYRERALTHDKRGGKRTFGPGLTPETHARLYSADLHERLAAIHDLEERWVTRRVESLRLNPEELARTQAQLRLARDEGVSLLQRFLQEGSTKHSVPGYHEGDECALCNVAAGMKLKLASSPANPQVP